MSHIIRMLRDLYRTHPLVMDAANELQRLQAEVTELTTVAADYDAALCAITMNLDEPSSAKAAQLVLDKHARRANA